MEDSKKDYLDKLRHSTAHLLAAAVLELYPGTKNAIGPAIEDGFYYDFDFPKPISEEDFPKIEAKMAEILKSWSGFKREEVTAEKAKKIFASNPYKLELIEEFAKEGQTITIYTSGSFTDLCRGGHVDNPKEEIKAFKLLSLAGAYWRGSEKNKMLTRIYGTAFPSQEELSGFIKRHEEAQKRDHRKIGRDLDLFTFSELVGPGLPLFTPKGTIIREELENFVRSLQEPLGYQRVKIPHLGKVGLYQTSGHWDKYKENMFVVIGDEEGEMFALKPMNCPHHIQIFASRSRSYRDLPQRYSEVTEVYRNEKSGELLGLSRVYMLTQDDAHIFCAEEQAISECLKIYSIIKEFYDVFNLGVGLKVRLSLRDPQHLEKYLGDEKSWGKAEVMMREVAQKANLEAYDGFGEAAFYAPKLDFMAYDSLGREWQLATIQLDFTLPERFDLSYIDKDGSKKRPVLIHRAILGSMERFMAILIEHFAGIFPTWLSPIQVQIIPITDRNKEYGQEVLEQLKSAEIRVEVDDRAETMQAKIRDATFQKIPYMIIIGDREEKEENISLRTREGKNLGTMRLKDFIVKIKEEIKSRRGSLET